MGLIEVRGINVYAFHGCLEEESRIGSEYIVDVEVEGDLSKPRISDELNATVDYVVINRVVEEEMSVRSKLIEHVAGRILDRLRRKFPGPERIMVKVSKLRPPVNGNVDHVSVTLEG